MAQSSDDLLDLLSRALAGNVRAETRLFEHLTPTIREGVICALYLADVRGQRKRRGPEDVEDFIQETHATLLKNGKAALRKFDPTRESGNLDAYVCRIAKNVTIAALRLQKSGRLETPTSPEDLPESVDGEDPEETLINRQLVDIVLAELELNEDEEELFQLCFVDRLSGPNVVALLEEQQKTKTKTLGALHQWTCRMREKCRNILAKWGGDGGEK